MSTLSLLFWFVLILALVLSGWGWVGAEPAHRRYYGGISLVWVAFAVIGIKLFPLAPT